MNVHYRKMHLLKYLRYETICSPKVINFQKKLVLFSNLVKITPLTLATLV